LKDKGDAVLMITLTVVLISKNQAWNIARLIESVLQGIACVSSKEIVLVDSASMDETVELASCYPIRILRLRPDQQLTPAAGRYVGYKHTKGGLVLFLDGDMELCPGWLEKALEVIHDRPEVAVVTGQIVDLPKTSGLHDKPLLANMDMVIGTEVPHGGGAAVYRRSVLEQVGSFNPYLYSEEEPELCLRIRHAGYRVLQLKYPIAYHYSDPEGALSTLAGRWRRNLYLGFGQVIRYSLGNKLLWLYLRERSYGCIPALGLTAALISFLWSLKSHQWVWFRLWVLLLVVTVSGDAYRKCSLYRAIFSLLRRVFIMEGTVRGFLLKPLNVESYPGRFDVIKWASQRSQIGG
jgi:GT2 family glycosyltransferase